VIVDNRKSGISDDYEGRIDVDKALNSLGEHLVLDPMTGRPVNSSYREGVVRRLAEEKQQAMDSRGTSYVPPRSQI